MKLEDKIVIAEWMGCTFTWRGTPERTYKWRWKKPEWKTGRLFGNESLPDYDSPNCPDSVWQEIYSNMTDKERQCYIQNIAQLSDLPMAPSYGQPGIAKIYWNHFMAFHTITPDIRTESLLNMIREMNNNG